MLKQSSVYLTFLKISCFVQHFWANNVLARHELLLSKHYVLNIKLKHSSVYILLFS